jgi:hypothetical protein
MVTAEEHSLSDARQETRRTYKKLFGKLAWRRKELWTAVEGKIVV